MCENVEGVSGLLVDNWKSVNLSPDEFLHCIIETEREREREMQLPF